MKYLVIRDCYGFKKRYWKKGEIVNIDKSENPPCHFMLVEAPPSRPASEGLQVPSSKGERKKVKE